MSTEQNWQCTTNFEKLKVVKEVVRHKEPKDEIQNPNLTVGQIFEVKCNGQSMDWDLSNIKIEAVAPPEKDFEYNIQLHELLKSSDTEIHFLAKTYQNKQNEIQFYIKDAKNQVLVDKLSLEVQSISETTKQQKPYGSMGAIQYDLPWYTWAILIAFIAFILISILVLIRNKRAKQLRQQELMSQIPSIGSYNYAHKELRSLELHIAAQSDFSGEILKLLKNYFMYSFVIDLENIKHAKKVASVIAQQEYFRTHIQEAKKLKLIFDEIAKLQDSKLNLNEEENLQFLTKIRDFINQFDASFKKHKPKNKLGGK